MFRDGRRKECSVLPGEGSTRRERRRRRRRRHVHFRRAGDVLHAGRLIAGEARLEEETVGAVHVVVPDGATGAPRAEPGVVGRPPDAAGRGWCLLHHGRVDAVAALVSCLEEQRVSVGFEGDVLLCRGEQRFGIGVGWLVSVLLVLFC
jgi:hypothetical protein